MSTGAIIVRRQNRYIRAFREARAESPATACPFGRVSVRDTRVFRRMVDRGVFVRTDGDQWYIDERAAEVFLRRRRIRMVVMAVAALIVMLVAIVLNW